MIEYVLLKMYSIFLGGNIGLLTGMRLITLLELFFWFIRFASRICFKFKGSQNLEIKKVSKNKGKKFLVSATKKQKKNKKPFIKVTQKKIKSKQI